MKDALRLDACHLPQKKTRRRKQNKTSPAKQLRNDHRAMDARINKITANYTNGDLFVTLTYDDAHLPSDVDEAVKIMNNFIRRLRRWKAELQYEMNLETGAENQRLHHHMIVKYYPGIEDIIRKQWGKYGHAQIRSIADNGNNHNIYALAVYFCKADENIKKVYKSSRNKKQPIIQFTSGAVQISDEYRCIRSNEFGHSKGGIRELVYIRNTNQ